MKLDKKIMPINTSKETYINFNLCMILSDEKMKAWFYERFVNILMYDNIIDFVDNVNYSGIITQVKSYSWDEINQLNTIIKQAIQVDNFLNIWVDEFDLPCSIRYKNSHFVHPIIVYGYDSNNKIYNAWFFDIEKGYRAVEILQRDFMKAVEDVKVNYLNGGTDASLCFTIGVFHIYNDVPKFPFNLQIFLSQLKDYLYGKNNYLLQRYNLKRAELIASQNVTYGINIYLRLINTIRNNSKNLFFPFKSLHDFSMHKWQLLLRLEYIQNYYEFGEEYQQYLIQVRRVKDLLEKVRLLNIKFQIMDKENPTSFSHNPIYLNKLEAVLIEAYNIEMKILPKIYKLLLTATYPKGFLENHQTKLLHMCDGVITDDYIEFDFSLNEKYIYRIDIIREGEYKCIIPSEKILLNDEIAYFIEYDALDHSPVRSIDLVTCLIKNIKLYTNTKKARYKILLFLLSRQDNGENNIFLSFNKDKNWHGFHHIENVNYNESCMQFDIIGIDPYMMYDNVNINADYMKYVQIRMGTNDMVNLSMLYFTTIDSPYISPEKSVSFHIDPGDKIRTYTIDLTNHPQWKGLIQSIRFDPVEYMITQNRKTKRSVCYLESVCFMKELHKNNISDSENLADLYEP